MTRFAKKQWQEHLRFQFILEIILIIFYYIMIISEFKKRIFK